MRWKPLSLAALVILAAGCGGGGHKAATTTTTAAAAAKTTSTATTTAATNTSAAATAAAAGLTGLATNANCRQLADLSAEYAQALQGTNSSNIQKTSSILKQFADKTPSDIRPAFETVAADYGKIAAALQGVNVKQGSVPSPAVIAKLAKLGTEIDTSALAKAETSIGTWAQKNCVAK
jgi:hypothetical protein